MKKSVIALSIFSMFTSVAIAQSSATLYGVLDVGYGLGNQGIYEGSTTGKGKFQQWGNSKVTSVWGLKGAEDLGNGMKVYFQLESEIDPENGDSGSFGEAAFVGVSGNFGAIQVGRQSTVSSNIMSEFDVSGAPTLTSSLGNAGISGDAQRFADDTYSHADSVIAYVSPEWSGFSFQAAVILKNDDVFAAGADAKNLYTLGALYNIGGLTLGATFESKPMSGVSASWGLGAKYDFGSFVVAASYFDNHRKEDGRGFSLGVSVPIGAFEFGAQIAYNSDAINGVKPHYGWVPNGSSWEVYTVDIDNKIKPFAWELFATYDLSKRTQLYAQYGGINNDAKQYNSAERKYSASIGIIHRF